MPGTWRTRRRLLPSTASFSRGWSGSRVISWRRGIARHRPCSGSWLSSTSSESQNAKNRYRALRPPSLRLPPPPSVGLQQRARAPHPRTSPWNRPARRRLRRSRPPPLSRASRPRASRWRRSRRMAAWRVSGRRGSRARSSRGRATRATRPRRPGTRRMRSRPRASRSRRSRRPATSMGSERYAAFDLSGALRPTGRRPRPLLTRPCPLAR